MASFTMNECHGTAFPEVDPDQLGLLSTSVSKIGWPSQACRHPDIHSERQTSIGIIPDLDGIMKATFIGDENEDDADDVKDIVP